MMLGLSARRFWGNRKTCNSEDTIFESPHSEQENMWLISFAPAGFLSNMHSDSCVKFTDGRIAEITVFVEVNDGENGSLL